jgi:hypothetical protein
MGWNRRDFLSVSAGSLGLMLVPRMALPSPRFAREEKDPHFCLQIFLDGGADNTYGFDARPLEMTQANLQQNYLAKEPEKFEGMNGNFSWATELTKPLWKFRQDFSVLNGVMMNPSFDGHPQQMNEYFAGNPFGGESFLPHLNFAKNSPLDLILSSRSFAEITNAEATVEITPNSLRDLKQNIKNLPDFGSGPLGNFLQSRFVANALGSGSFSQGAKLMAEGFLQTGSLKEKIKEIQDSRDSEPEEIRFAKMAGSVFRTGVARSAMIFFAPNLDTHDFNNCKEQPEKFRKIFEQIAGIFQTLKDMPFDEHRSIFDLTTVIVSSEFGRTMRQLGRNFAETGTDHNAFSNSLILAGKGIRGNQVIGNSDFQTSKEELSKAHLQIDREKLKLIGRPFDYATGKSLNILPEVFSAKNYLNISSVINTIYSLYRVPESYYRLTERNGAKAPVISHLLS